MIAAVALASEEPVDPSPPTETYEVVVYGELQVAKARAAVVQLLEDMGYDGDVIERGNAVVYRHVEPWKGEVVLYDDGWVQVKRQPLYVEGRQMPWARRNTPLAWVGCFVWPYLCVRSSGATYGQRKWRQVEDDAVEVLDPKVRNLGDRVADLATERAVERLPDRLQRLWQDGEPLGSGPALETPEARRRALFEYWASRTETPWGDTVRDAVEAFCRAVVQTSDAPYSPEELAAYSTGARPFLSPLAREPTGE